MFRPGTGTTSGLVAATPVVLAARLAVGTDSDAASSRLSMVIAGLIALAVVLTVSTIVFWRATRPDRAGGGEIGVRWIQPDAASNTVASSNAASSSAVANNGVPNSGVPNNAVPNNGVPNSAVPNSAGPNSAAPNKAASPAAVRPEAPSAPTSRPAPAAESPGPDYGALRPRPADG
ncbi:MAG: hypothetical protein M3Y51_10160 [Actinomycetota bacterium]|nr:hypothetical protein [Actinomycetota bacterium]